MTRGWDGVRGMVKVDLPLPPPETPSWMTERVCGLARTSLRKVATAPSSATSSTPALAMLPLDQNVTSPECTAPISVVKCAPPTTPPGVLEMVQLPSNSTW